MQGSVGDAGHDGSIGHAQVLDAAHLQLRVQHRAVVATHGAGAALVIGRRAIAADIRLQIRHPLNLGPGQQFPVNMFYDRRLTHHLAHTRHRG